MPIKLVVTKVTVDPLTHAPMVLLRQVRGHHHLSMCIGVIEARAIARQLHGAAGGPAQTHDAWLQSVQALGGQVDGVTLFRGPQQHLAGKIALRHHGAQLLLDARPCDAVALALGSDAPIWCHEDALVYGSKPGRAALQAPRWGNGGPRKASQAGPTSASVAKPGPIVLASLADEDFGKYEM